MSDDRVLTTETLSEKVSGSAMMSLLEHLVERVENIEQKLGDGDAVAVMKSSMEKLEKRMEVKLDHNKTSYAAVLQDSSAASDPQAIRKIVRAALLQESDKRKKLRDVGTTSLFSRYRKSNHQIAR